MSEWKTYRIGDVSAIYDGPHATPKKTETGPWFLSISSLQNGRLDLSQSAHLSEEDFTRWTRRVTPQPEDILFSYETRLGEAALMPQGLQACLGRRMGLLRPNQNIVDPRFLLSAYLSPTFQDIIASRKIHGATVDRIPLTDLPDWPVHLPPLHQQRAISTLLGALDNKIEVNDHITRTALDLARQIFRESLEAKHSVVEIGALLTLKYGKALREPDRRSGTVPVFGCTGQVGWHDEPLTDLPTAVVGRKGANAGCVSWSPTPPWVIDTAFYAKPSQDWLSPEIAFLLLETASLPGLVGDSAIPGLNREMVHHQLVKTPTPAVANKMTLQIHEIMSRAFHAEAESRTLAELRDTLLPELMSGRLRVKEAEKIVEDVT